jgi:L-Ala-D/L-Glu epimerase
MGLSVKAWLETFPIAGKFVISRETRTEQRVVTVEVSDGQTIGRAECVPYPRYGETVDGVIADIMAQAPALAGGLDRVALQTVMKAGAARNGLDCALWDYQAKDLAVPAWLIAGMSDPQPLTTCYTLSLGSPEDMNAAAIAASARPLLKVKLGGPGDPERIAAVRAGAPGARLVVDANEAWTPDIFDACMAACVAAGVELVEQPLKAGADEALEHLSRPVAVCADESLHDRAGLAGLRRRYDAINVKLDKAGGLTEALALVQEARSQGFRIMVGCMLGSSLAMAPAVLAAQRADVVDLDGPLLLARDRVPGLVFEGSTVHPPTSELWG